MFEEHLKNIQSFDLRDESGDYVNVGNGRLKSVISEWDKWAVAWKAEKKLRKDLRKLLHEETITPKKNTHCFICGEKEKPRNRHHIQPKAIGLPKGKELIRTCLRCHQFIHIRWTNVELRQMTAHELRAKLLEELMIGQT